MLIVDLKENVLPTVIVELYLKKYIHISLFFHMAITLGIGPHSSVYVAYIGVKQTHAGLH